MAKNQKPDSQQKKYSFRKFSGKKADFPNLEEDCVIFFNKTKSQYIGDYGRCFFEKFKLLGISAMASVLLANGLSP